MISMGWLCLGGLAQALALAWPWGGQTLPALQIIGMVTLAAHLSHCQKAKKAFWHSWWFATVWLVGTFWWLFTSMHTYGGMPAPLAVLAADSSSKTSALPRTGVSFHTSDAELQQLYDAAESKAASNIVQFTPTMKALVEGGGYENVWIETQPMGGEMYARRNLEVALNKLKLKKPTLGFKPIRPSQWLIYRLRKALKLRCFFLSSY